MNLFGINNITRQQQNRIQIKLMDPRPYHFQFRKPRVSNPTFQSPSLYESIYHRGSYSNIYPNKQKIQNQPPYQLPRSNQNLERKQNVDEIINQRIRQIDPQVESYTQRKNDNNRNYNNNFIERPKNQAYQRNIIDKSQVFQPQARDSSPYDKANYNDNGSNYGEKERFSQPRSYSQEVSTHNRSSAYKEPGYMSGYGDKLMRPMPGKDQDRIYRNQQKPYNIISCYPNQPTVHRQFPKLTLENKLIETGQYFGQPINYNPQRY